MSTYNPQNNQNDIGGGAFKGSFQYQFRTKKLSGSIPDPLNRNEVYNNQQVEDKADGFQEFQRVDLNNQNNYLKGSLNDSEYGQD